MRCMITINFDPQHMQEISALVPEEQKHDRASMERGTLEAIYISADRVIVRLVMKGETQEQIQQELSEFPLYPYMKTLFIPFCEKGAFYGISTSRSINTFW
jgi:muconolactone delta-isomerase